MVQASLFALVPDTYEIGCEEVSDELALRPNLVKIVISKFQPVTKETTKFYLPVQWTAKEAASLLYDIRGVSWQLGEDGKPIAYAHIIDICEEFCKKNFQTQAGEKNGSKYSKSTTYPSVESD